MDALYTEANELFMNDDYENALELYTKGIKECSDTNLLVKFYLGRSQTHLKLSQAQLSLNDAEQAIKLNPSDAKGYLKKGMALYHLKEYKLAYEAIEIGNKHSENETKATKNLLNDWFVKCSKFYTPPVPSVEEPKPQIEQIKEDHPDESRKELIDDINKIAQEIANKPPPKNTIK